jgi:hypothetical protein
MEQEPTFILRCHFGYVKPEARFRPTPDGRLIGESRRLVYDERGNLTETTQWEPTGVVARFG